MSFQNNYFHRQLAGLITIKKKGWQAKWRFKKIFTKILFLVLVTFLNNSFSKVRRRA